MIELENLLTDEEFIFNVKEDQHLTGDYIKLLLQNNQDSKEVIYEAIDFLRHYQSEKVVDQDTINNMWRSVLTESLSRKTHSRFKVVTLIKVAASLAIIMLLSYFVYDAIRMDENNTTDKITEFANKGIENGNQARIITSNGSEFLLTENGSKVEYGKDGKEIIVEGKENKKETFKNSSDETEFSFDKFIVPYGTRHSVKLSDGTMVQLNSGSSLVFPAVFSGKKREVYLKGEGYFTVTENKNMPFIVKTDNINIKVLGTKFNVSAYENDNSASTVLVEGSVEVCTNNSSNKNHRRIVPGQGCFYSINNSDFNVKDVDLEKYVSWTSGVLKFRGESFVSVLEKVKRFYNVDISINDEELANRSISGKLVLSEKIEETLAYMASTTKSRYYSENDTFIFN